LKDEGLDIVFHQLDVTDPVGASRLAGFVQMQLGRVDVLVNNAGVIKDPSRADLRASDSASDTPLEAVQNVLAVNFYGPLMLSQALIPLMQGRGRVVNVSSGLGQLAEMGGGHLGYRVSKTALNALTRILAEELKDTQIKVNSVCPGWVRTDMGGASAARSVEQGVETIVWLATLPDDGPSGGFFRDKQQIPW
jgi:NAD(P)-dependent dehydrogenase (short-subunit alcohol dehydrogenase family)